MANNVSLRDLHSHIKHLDRLVSDARVSGKSPPELDFDSVRTHCSSIMEMLGDAPAQDAPESKADVETRADYQRGANDTDTDLHRKIADVLRPAIRGRDPEPQIGNRPPHAADARPRKATAAFDPLSLYTFGK